jgi:hypothetical protein
LGTKYYVFELTTGQLAEGLLADGYPSEAEALDAIQTALLRPTAGVYSVVKGYQQSALESVGLQVLELEMLQGGGLIGGIDSQTLSI